MTVSDVANALKVSDSIVYQLVKTGALMAHRIGCGRGVIRISAEDYGNYLEGTKQPSDGTPMLKRGRATAVAPEGFRHIDVSRVPRSKTSSSLR